MKEKLPQILTVLGLLMYPLSRLIYPKLATEDFQPTWILYAGMILTGIFIATAFSLQFKKMLDKRAIVQGLNNKKK